MAQAKCANGHIYDPEIYGDRCPYCDHKSETIYFNDGSAQQESVRKTTPLGGARNSDIKKEPSQKSEKPKKAPEDPKPLPENGSQQIKPETISKTTPPKEYVERQQEISKTVAEFQKQHGYDPVVGWLVCVKGNDKRQDYRLRPRTNLIGRNREMDVQIKGEDTISSDTHAKIDYSVKRNRFFLIPGNNRSTIYCNEEEVYSPQELKAYDRISFGSTDLLFIPFCSDHFIWEEGE